MIPDIKRPELATLDDGVLLPPPGRQMPAPCPDQALFPGIADADVMARCYEAFITADEPDLEAAAAVAGANYRTAKKWAADGGWLRRRADLDGVDAAVADLQLQRLRVQKRNIELESQVETGSKLRGRIDELLETAETLGPKALADLGSALKAAGDNTVRALGVNESGAAAAAEAKSGKAPLVVVIPGGGAPVLKRVED